MIFATLNYGQLSPGQGFELRIQGRGSQPMALKVWLDIPTYDWTNGNSQCLCWWFGFASRWDRSLFVAVRGSKRNITGPKWSRHMVQRVTWALHPLELKKWCAQQVKLVTPFRKGMRSTGSKLDQVEKGYLVDVPISKQTHIHEACNLLYRYTHSTKENMERARAKMSSESSCSSLVFFICLPNLARLGRESRSATGHGQCSAINAPGEHVGPTFSLV